MKFTVYMNTWSVFLVQIGSRLNLNTKKITKFGVLNLVTYSKKAGFEFIWNFVIVKLQ